MKRKVIVACGGAVATSTMAAEEIKELCDANHIELDLVQCRVTEIETYMDGADSICTTARSIAPLAIFPSFTVCLLFPAWVLKHYSKKFCPFSWGNVCLAK